MQDTNRWKVILDLCTTQWLINQEVDSHFYPSFIFIPNVLEVIVMAFLKIKFLTCLKMIWDPSSKVSALPILNVICTFKFLITFLCVYEMLSHLSGITIKFEGFTIHIPQAFNEIESAKEVYKLLKCEIDQQIYIIYELAILMVEIVNV